jgi:cyclic-di-AMP phosphodiesterase PgpH
VPRPKPPLEAFPDSDAPACEIRRGMITLTFNVHIQIDTKSNAGGPVAETLPTKNGAAEKGRKVARDFFERMHWRRMLLTAALALIAALALAPNLLSQVPNSRIGEYNVGNYRAPFQISIVDQEATVQASQAAIAEVPPVFHFNPGVYEKTAVRLAKSFGDMNALFGLLSALDEEKRSKKEKAAKTIAAQTQVKQALVAERPTFAEHLGVTLSDAEFELLIQRRFSPALAERINGMLKTVLSDYVTFELEEIRAVLGEKGADHEGGPDKVVVRVAGQDQQRTIESLKMVVSPNQAESSLEDLAAENLADLRGDLRRLLLKIAKAQVKPNLNFNAEATADAKRAVSTNVVPVTIAFDKNELVIGDGSKVTRQIFLVFDHVRQRSASSDWTSHFFGMAMVVFVTLLLTFWLTDVNMPSIRITDRDAMLVGVLLVATLFSLRMTEWFDERLTNLFTGKPDNLLYYLFPIAAPAMLVRFLTRFETGLAFAVVLSFLAALAFQLEPVALPLLFLSMLVGVHFMGNVTRRGQVLRAGLWVGFSFVAQIFILAFLKQDFTATSLLAVPLCALVGGVFSGVLVLGLAPLFEYGFGFMTDISLLELANYEHPLLKRLARRTPGTFHHSIAISSLAEAAAEAIGANRLLVRVGAMYHDIGKSMNPRFFVENQRGNNPHDKITDPIESARIVIAHVTDGSKLAHENKLPQDIIDFIEQHHGTRAVTYFLAKARENAEAEGRELDESIFHYPGPKPQTKETAILMICDVCEARSRTIEDRSPKNVAAMINDMTEILRREGQFDQCPLTQGDFKKITRALTGVVLGMHHERIAYPDQTRKRLRGIFSRS